MVPSNRCGRQRVDPGEPLRVRRFRWRLQDYQLSSKNMECEPVMRNFVNRLRRSIEWHRRWLHPYPEGEAGLKVRDHRAMVGSNWDKIGQWQFDFMKSRGGLTPDDVFCDVACGSFRGGRFFVPYLKPGHYLGIDKQDVLIREGRVKEIPPDVWDRQKPEIVISSAFEFDRF